MQHKIEDSCESCLVSIIMPVYNTEEKYLIKSIESVVRQKHTNFELIIVDDGSSDNIARVCDRLAENDSRIQVIHKNNEGVSAARNDALKIIQGAYYTFLDSDDVWGTDFLHEMLATIYTYDLDMVMCSYSTISEDDELLKMPKEKNEIELLQTSVAIEKLLYMSYPSDASAVFSTMYKACVLKEFFFDDRVALAEDALYKFECMKASSKIAYLHKVLMSYRIRSSGAMKSSFKEKYLSTLTELEELIQKNPEYKAELVNRLVRISFVLLRMKGITHEHKCQIRKVIKKYRWFVVKNTRCDLKMFGAIAVNYLGLM